MYGRGARGAANTIASIQVSPGTHIAKPKASGQSFPKRMAAENSENAIQTTWTKLCHALGLFAGRTADAAFNAQCGRANALSASPDQDDRAAGGGKRSRCRSTDCHAEDGRQYGPANRH